MRQFSYNQAYITIIFVTDEPGVSVRNTFLQVLYKHHVIITGTVINFTHKVYTLVLNIISFTYFDFTIH